MNKKIELTLDADPWITEEGVKVCVFIGGDEKPTEYHYTWEEIIDKHIDCEIVRGFDGKTVFLNEHNITELEGIAHSLETLLSKIYDLIYNSYIFDRDAWLESNNGEYNQENKEQFLTKVRND